MHSLYLLAWIFVLVIPLTLGCFGFWYFYHPTRCVEERRTVYKPYEMNQAYADPGYIRAIPTAPPQEQHILIYT